MEYITQTETAYSFKYSHVLKAYDTKFTHGTVIEFFIWKDFSFEQYLKWKWYFEYRYALLRIKYPKNCIEYKTIKRPLNALEAVDHLKNKIIGKKRTITKYKNKLLEFSSNWNSLFPIEADLLYINATQKIQRLVTELEILNKNL
jgi:hypothetical protein